MKTISQLLDEIKEKHDLKSDYKLALFMGIGGGNLANYRHGKSLPDESACEKIAAALEIDPDVLIAQMNSTRAKTPEVKARWQRIAHRLEVGAASAAMSLVVAIISLAGFSPNAEATALSFDKSGPPVYIMLSNALLRLRVWLRKKAATVRFMSMAPPALCA